MFFIPLTQIESVELVIHSLKTAAGEADCRSCPASKVCTKQCLAIARAIEQMFGEGTLPGADDAEALLAAELTREKQSDGTEQIPEGKAVEKSHLRLVKSQPAD